MCAFVLNPNLFFISRACQRMPTNFHRHNLCKSVYMKRILLCIAIVYSLLLSCNDEAETSAGPGKKSKKISARNLSITPSNSYSDLFLDSATVENYIMEKKIPDSIAWRIRSFYNSRNFEFASFSFSNPYDGFTSS